MVSAVSKSMLWCALVVGLVGTTIGVYALRVEWTVTSLIVASVSALVLLDRRPQAHDQRKADRLAS